MKHGTAPFWSGFQKPWKDVHFKRYPEHGFGPLFLSGCSEPCSKFARSTPCVFRPPQPLLLIFFLVMKVSSTHTTFPGPPKRICGSNLDMKLKIAPRSPLLRWATVDSERPVSWTVCSAVAICDRWYTSVFLHSLKILYIRRLLVNSVSHKTFFSTVNFHIVDSTDILALKPHNTTL